MIHEAQSTMAAKSAPVRAVSSHMLQRQCACGQHSSGESECASCKKKDGEIQRAAMAATNGSAPPIVHSVLNGPGQALDNGTRAFMESRFGQDLSSIRVHTDDVAAQFASTPRAFRHDEQGRKFLNLQRIARVRLDAAGMDSANVNISAPCTSCFKDAYYSHRAEGPTGRFAAVIGLDPLDG